MYRRISLLLVFVFVAACSAAADDTTTSKATTTIPTTTSTTAPTTTSTTIPPFTVEGAPAELTALVEDFYAYAAGEISDAPPMPEPVLAGIEPTPAETPMEGVASVGTFKEQGVATVEIDGDLFLAIDDGEGWRIVGGSWPSLSVPAYYGPTPRLVAVVGSDARPGEDILTTRTDSIHFVGLDGAGAGGIVGVPRDSYVSIAGGGRSKINAALSWVGPEGMMQTFKDVSGLPLEGYVMTGFAGFVEMVGTVLGGFELQVPAPMHDKASGANFEPGPQIVDGNQALAFARTRKTLANGDFGRSANHGLIMLDVLRYLKGEGFGSIPRLMELSEPHMLTDLSPEQILTFSALSLASDLDAIPNVVAPGSAGWAGRASVVYLSGSVADLWADLADGRLGS